MTNLQVSIHNNIIYDGEIIPLKYTQELPKINFTKHNSDKYTIIMVDPDAPSRKNPIYKYFLHWLIINNNEIIMDFTPPAPPKNSGPHRYFIFVLKQNKLLNSSSIKINNKMKREKFNLAEFIADNDLEIIDSKHFITKNK
ncbi:phosphatidylethanolamine-binding protein-like protein [Megavirus courdo11]|uniref:Phosphatidylethanolamine-binding protein-like protein n=2 Tax=Megavirus TaxID=3044761 RepID=K7Z7B1_9VIRU|nr:phosphatidyl ethanolamine-binding protein-like protein [Megavirus courdo7]AFX92116.1 phosphatidylethanolamine-binding protein-like protein [Megavirus courdo11]